MSIRASASAQQIIPEKPLKLAGYSTVERLSTDTEEPIFASAIHLRSGGAGLVIVSLDLFNIDPCVLNKARKEIQAQTSTPAESLFIGTTQTHSAPATSRCLRWFGTPGQSEPDQPYVNLVVEQAAAAASEATGTSRPASIAFIDLEKPNTGAILIREDPSGKIIAVLIIHDDVPNYLGSDSTKTSSDFIGTTRKELTAKFGGSPVICFFPSPQGTSKILNYGKQQEKGSAVDAGKALANLIVGKIRTLKKSDFTDDVSLIGEIINVPAKTKTKIPPVQEAGMNVMSERNNRQKRMKQDLNDDDRIEMNWSMINAVQTLGFSMALEKGYISHFYEDYRSFEVQKITIGDTTILGAPCTMTAECAKLLSERSEKRLLIADSVNGDAEGSILVVEGECSGLLSPIFTVENGQPLLDAAIKLVQ